jgi:hypothetical protein
MSHRRPNNLWPSPLIAAFLLVACGDNGTDTTTGTDSTGANPSSTGSASTPSTDPTTTNGPTTPTTTDATDSGMTGSATMATDPTTGNPTTTTTNPTSATDTDPGTTTGSTTNPIDTTTTDTSSSGDMDTSTGTTDGTTGEDPNFGEIPETCEQAELSKSTVGCLFYAIDMDSHDLLETGQYAVAIANVQKDKMANITIERKQNNVWNTIVAANAIGQLNLKTYNLPDQHTNDSQLAAGFAYRVKSDVPAIAYQFNPVDGQNSFLSDAAMLYPVTAWDHINHAVSFTSTVDNTNTNQFSYGSAVAYVDGTKITVTPKVATRAGAGVPAGQPGVPFEVTLNEGDVLSVAVQQIGTSMSGTTFESVKETPFAMFTGIECALIPTNVCCCDHVEEQISGVRLWGKNFVGARVPVRNNASPETSLWQLYGSEDDTTVTLVADAQVTGLPANPIKLNKGQVVEFYAGGPTAEPGDFEITADKPIAVMNYMTGAENMPAPFNSTGDPLSVQIPAVEQYLPRYVVLVPGTWTNDVGVFTRKAGAMITIDGVVIPDIAFNPVGNSGFEVARVPLTDGVHVLEGDGTPFSVIVVGYDQHDSYGYLGGTGTKIINPDPQ